MFCMRNFTTNIMCGPVEDGNLCKMFGVLIVEKNLHIIQGPANTLVHYLFIAPLFCRNGLGTSMLKMVMNQPEYEHRRTMVVTSLPKYYKNILFYDSIDDFFDTFFQ